MDDHENARLLPYPRMDIDYLRWESRGKGVTYYNSTVITKIHYLVQYRCRFCGAQNRDEDQYFELKNRTFSNDMLKLIQNEDQIVRDIKRREGRIAAAARERDIAARKYELLGLKCRCAQCGKKQLWSDFWPVSGIFGWAAAKGYMVSDVIFFLLLAVCLLLVVSPQLVFAGVLLPFVPSAASVVHNKVMQIKCRKLEKEMRPVIRIVYRTEAETPKD